MKRQKILMLLDVAEFYSLNSENKQFIIIFENINAAEEYFLFFMLIIQNQKLMKTWFSDCLSEDIKILISKNGFISNKITLEYLQHYIDNSNVGRNDDWKLMFMNNYENYITSEFILLIDKHRIRSYFFIFHLTHCMQSLNVIIFQQYKHSHDVIIQNAMIEFNVEYFLIRFCQNLIQIQNNTFKKIFIQMIFRKSDMYFIDAFQCIVQFRKFVSDVQTKNRKNEESFSVSFSNFVLFRIQFQTLKKVEYGLDQWKLKIDAVMQWNDSVREEELNQYVSHTRQMIAESQFKDDELFFYQKRRHDELMQRATFRKRLKPTFEGMGITKKNALAAIAEKRRKKNELIKKKEHNNFMRMWRMKRDDLLTKDIIAQKKKKARLKKVKDYTKRKIQMSDENTIPIIDSEMEWKTSNSTWLAEKVRKTKTKSKHQISINEKNDVDFIIDIQNDSKLRNEMMRNDDFVTFEKTDSDENVQRHLEKKKFIFDTITQSMAWM